MNTSLHTTQKTTFLYHVITVCIFCCCTFGGFLTAQDDMGFEIIPELKSDEMATGQTSIQKI
ncbi:MAG: hypothetical protein LBP53_08455 [Candidatus Peribacteria bacterium]|jgi:hypothetical protein|nr:hypothetical protein [Candidatus Peribacteria bacterium]